MELTCQSIRPIPPYMHIFGPKDHGVHLPSATGLRIMLNSISPKRSTQIWQFCSLQITKWDRSLWPAKLDCAPTRLEFTPFVISELVHMSRIVREASGTKSRAAGCIFGSTSAYVTWVYILYSDSMPKIGFFWFNREFFPNPPPVRE